MEEEVAMAEVDRTAPTFPFRAHGENSAVPFKQPSVAPPPHRHPGLNEHAILASSTNDGHSERNKNPLHHGDDGGVGGRITVAYDAKQARRWINLGKQKQTAPESVATMAGRGIYDDDPASDSESDVDGDGNAHAPSDGYFERRSHPREQFVQNSTLAPSEAKAREAAEQQRSFGRDGRSTRQQGRRPSSRASSAGSSSVLTPDTPRARSPARWASEQTPLLLDAGPAPPSYSDATAGRDYSFQGAQPPEQTSPRPRSEPRPSAGYGSIVSPDRNPGPPPNPAQARRDLEAGEESADDQPRWPFGERGNPFGSGPPPGVHGPPFGPHGVLGSNGVFGHHVHWAASPTRQNMSDDAAGDESRHRHWRSTRPRGAWRGRGGRGGWRGRGGGWQRESRGGREDCKKWRCKKWWKRQIKGWRDGLRSGFREKRAKRRCVFGIVIVALIVVVICMMGGYFNMPSDKNKPDDPNVPSQPDQPDKQPIADPITGDPFPRDPYLEHPRSTKCNFTHSSPIHTETFQFGGLQSPNLTLIERLELGRFIQGGISGTVSVVAAASDQEEDIAVLFHVATTAPYIVKDFDMIKRDTSLEFIDVRYEYTGESGTGYSPCLDVAIEVRVSKKATVDNFVVHTLHLDVIGVGSLFPHAEGEDIDRGFTIKNRASINTVAGNVQMPYFSSRETYISTVSGRVEGTYALRDVLDIETKSGTINVSVSPHKVDPERPNPAELRIDSVSGTVKTKWVVSRSLPERDYRCSAKTRSSYIQGTFILGSLTTLASISGHIEADIIPYDVGQDRSTLQTDTVHGSHSINLQSPYQSSGFWRTPPIPLGSPPLISRAEMASGMLTRLDSTHTSTSGSINLVYPPEWAGSFSTKSVSGRITITGKDVKIDKGLQLPGRFRYEGTKGDGESKLVIKTISSTISAQLGNL